MRLRGPGRLAGDPALTIALAPFAQRRRTGDIAAVLVDLNAEDEVRMAFAGQADADRRFELGAITKGLTGLLVADAIDREELRPQTRVEDLLGAYDGSPLGRLSVAELCTHTSGLPRTGPLGARGWGWRLFGMDPYGQPGRERLLARTVQAGTIERGQYLYSDLGAALVGALLETAAGRGYGELLSQRLCQPLNMTATTLSAGPDTVSWGRAWSGGRRAPWRMGAYGPAAGVISNARDMSRLLIALLDGSAPGVDALDPVAGITGLHAAREAGLFWIIQHRGRFSRGPYVWHNGQTGGYSAFLALWPRDRRAILVLAGVANAAQPEEIALALERTAPPS